MAEAIWQKRIRKNPRETEDRPIIRSLVRTNKIKAIPLVRWPLRKIYQLPSLISRTSNTQFPRFGPCYHADDSWGGLKEKAWHHVCRCDRGVKETSDIYLAAIGRIEEKARATYEDKALQGLTESQFRWMMIKDGCFFLQLALFILGASKQLGYPDNHLIFGEEPDKKNVLMWTESMFYVGNQLPLVVLMELMKQTFFVNVIGRHGKWERPTGCLSKQVLYDLLILPEMRYYATYKTSSSLLEMLGRKTYMTEEQPSDLLHVLQNLLLGPRGSRNDSYEEDDEEDEEDVDEEEGDLEAGRPSNIKESQGDLEAGRPSTIKESLCVSRFAKKGIYLRESTGIGIRGIEFKNHMFYASLYLPTMLVNEETEMLFRHLKWYECLQKKKGVTSYLGFMNQLISTYDDVELLAKKGIIQASKPYYKKRFMSILKCFPQETTASRYRYIMQQVGDYTVWDKLRDVAILALIFTILQTILAVLSFVSQLRKSPP